MLEPHSLYKLLTRLCNKQEPTLVIFRFNGFGLMEVWTSTRKNRVLDAIALLGIVLVLINCVESRQVRVLDAFEYPVKGSSRKYGASLADFGGVGDGVTSNTKAFQAAIDKLRQYASDGGSLLFVPPGKWLTCSFNLTSHFTLFLHKHAALLASQDESEWAVIDPLPSYGRGRDAECGRYISLIFGTNLTDIVITGENGIIDGQGFTWWRKFRKGELKYTRPYLIEIMYSSEVQISNLTLMNPPSWNIHPVYSSNVVVQGLRILALVKSPNTGGINPDSCTNTRIEDCFIVSGDDCVAVTSGWDEYGIRFGMPTKRLAIKRLRCVSPFGAMIALGTEMSGGIEDVRAEDIAGLLSESGVRIKTAVGRGNYVQDIYVRGMYLVFTKMVFWMEGNDGSHPDNDYDPNAIPVIQNINFRDVVAESATMAARLEGIPGHPFTGICISNATIGLGEKPMKVQWSCTDIAGVSSDVTPQPCGLLTDQGPENACNFPEDSFPFPSINI